MADDTRTNSLITTTAGTMTAATFAPTVHWILLGCPIATMPESTPLMIAAAAIVVGHAIEKMAAAWWARRMSALAVPVPPAPPGAQQ
jgi:hypothetical protein